MTYHFLHAFWFRLMIDLKISEIRRQLTNGELTLDELEKMFLGNRAHNK